MSLTIVAAIGARAELAHANGRPPATNGVLFQPGDSKSVYVRSTFGLLISKDEGCSFRWVCEQNIGYGGIFDPKYAIARDGAIFATTFNGLRVSRDGGCSFTTATESLPTDDPNRLAGRWVDALALGSTGEIWVATADSGRTNDIYRSTDNGVSFASRGMVSPTIWWKSLAVAPSDPARVYASGYEIASPSGGPAAHVFTTDDGGETWKELPLAGVMLNATPVTMIAAIDPANPSQLYLRSVGANGGAGMGDRLYRSTDAGATFTEVLVTTEPILDVVIQNASTVLVASATGGTFRSGDGGETFAPIAGAPRLGCLSTRPDGSLIGCATNWDPDFMAVGSSTDAAQWQKLFRFVELAGPVECAPGTTEHDVCDQELWNGLKQQFGAKGPTNPACALPPEPDGAPEEPKPAGCCDAGDDSPFGAASLMVATLWLLGRRRRPPNRTR